jgi:hypothetical protein
VGRDFVYGGNGLWVSGCASGGPGGPEWSGTPALIEVVVRNGPGFGGIEVGGLVEVVREGVLSDLVVFRLPRAHGEVVGDGPLAGWIRGGEVGSTMWPRIRVMGSGSVRNAMRVRGAWQVQVWFWAGHWAGKSRQIPAGLPEEYGRSCILHVKVRQNAGIWPI